MIPDSWPEDREHEQWKPYWLGLTKDDARCSAMLACLEMLRNGTTTFGDNGGRFEAELNAGVIEEVGLRGMVGEMCWDNAPYPEVSVGDTANCLRRLERLCHKWPWQRGSRVWAGVSMAGIYACSDELLTGGKALADRFGVTLDMHRGWDEPADLAHLQRLNVRPSTAPTSSGVESAGRRGVPVLHQHIQADVPRLPAGAGRERAAGAHVPHER